MHSEDNLAGHIFRAVLLAACCAWPAAGWAAELRPLVLALDALPPWKTYDGGQFGGAYTEIVRELARRTGQPLDIRNCPLPRCLHMLEHGEADIIIGIKDTQERKRYLHFLRTPYRKRSSDKVFYVAKGQGATLRSYADLASLRIGVTYGAHYFDRFDRDMSLTRDVVPYNDASFRKLALGRIDAVLIPEDQGEAQVARLNLHAVVEKARYREADPTPRSIAIARNSPHAANVAAFEKAMAAMVKDGTLAALIQRHYYDSYHVPAGAVRIR